MVTQPGSCYDERPDTYTWDFLYESNRGIGVGLELRKLRERLI